MSHYVITGGAGFIGSHLCEQLLTEGHQLTVFDDLSTGKRDNVPEGVELVIGSITDAPLVQSLTADIDGCFHLAAIASVKQCEEQWAASHAVNLTGTINLFEASIKRGQDGGTMFPIVYTSSAAVYGEVEQLPVTESTPTRPLGPYGADKLGCDLHAAAARQVYGLPSMGLRPFNVYGPRQDPSSPYSGVISIFANHITAGQPLTIFGDGEQTRDFIYVKDVAKAFAHAMGCLQSEQKALPPVINLCTGHATTVNQLAEIIARLANKKADISYKEARAGDIRHSVGDPCLIKDVLRVKRAADLSDGLSHLLQS